jgi:RsiW-degrading membrane proteinase PrsW (M82 family)
MDSTVLGYAFIGGLLPSLIWLYFVLKEDHRCPEPPRVIILAFLAGMLAVPIALPIERLARVYLLDQPTMFLSWALIEETLKYIAAACFILWRREVDEAPDYVIYMITVALGFAAAENMLFLFSPLAAGQFTAGVLTGNLRFLGSTLLHVTASATLGLAFAISESLSPQLRALAAELGLILSVALHTTFNTFIITEGASSALAAFFLVWIVAVVLLAAFEVLKYFQYRNLPNDTCTPS